MTKPEMASEPTMDEILASIRKIIAEEPVGSRPVAAAPAKPLLPTGGARYPELGRAPSARGEAAPSGGTGT